MSRKKTKADKVRDRLRFMLAGKRELPSHSEFVTETKIPVTSSHYSTLKAEVWDADSVKEAHPPKAQETPLQKLEKAGKEIAKIMEVGRYVLVVFQLDEETGRPTMELQEAPPPPKRLTL